jgi:hypothetical protein
MSFTAIKWALVSGRSSPKFKFSCMYDLGNKKSFSNAGAQLGSISFERLQRKIKRIELR